MEKDLEFPCEIASLLDVYDPYHVNGSLSPPPARGETLRERTVDARRFSKR